MRATFTKAERITSRKVIDQLFKKGGTDGKQNETRTFYLFPFRLLYLPASPPDAGLPDDAPSATDQPALVSQPVAYSSPLPAILITVSKRNFKRAVDRNRIRRRIREAYRLNKSLVFGTADKPKAPPAYITFIYTVKTEISFSDIEKGMKLALSRIN